jgi:transposase
MITNGALHDDPGGDFCTRHNPGKTRQRAIDQLRQLGCTVTLEPLKTAVAQ